ncbi:MAG: DUF86 domain-containing protein [Elusimicrobia bacterium]|nr:DUF86 domain-containing protein [Elusimicrobiota bacterium]MBP9128514.1 DUF86 domain-containing protein [Elusimicrobiota bacterium]MBP9699352.1 DUF86 domain-containing protein [Elusimicrobiota bacterium]
MDSDIYLGKKSSIERCLSRIKEEMASGKDPLRDLTRMDAVVLNLQRACEMSIDVAIHAISHHQLGLPQTARDAFRILTDAKVLTHDLGERLKKMVGFRNIAVHDYQSVTPEILQLVLRDHLNDFNEFLAALEHQWPLPPPKT